MANERELFLRDELVQLVRDEIVRREAELPASCEATGEVDGVPSFMVIDSDANCFRVTVREI